ncbi:hypothetical protein GLYMA_13G094050v4 [Glycine max]|nr:hypothetical protein GLYMA_13G094050v4 [Glycine max]KAH1100592.1 hypothetical protein GYH30_035641 [Glycine max]
MICKYNLFCLMASRLVLLKLALLTMRINAAIQMNGKGSFSLAFPKLNMRVRQVRVHFHLNGIMQRRKFLGRK